MAHPELRSLGVFCGANFGRNPAFRQAAEGLAELLARRRVRLIYGGGNVGLMGVLADTAMQHGGDVVGVIPSHLHDREVAHHGITELRLVPSMHERKRQIYELSDAVMTLPGGMGSLDELFETLTWNQLDLHHRPCGLLNVGGYWDPLLAQLDRAVEEGFVRPQHRALLLVDDDAPTLLDRLTAEYRAAGAAPRASQWVRPAPLASVGTDIP